MAKGLNQKSRLRGFGWMIAAAVLGTTACSEPPVSKKQSSESTLARAPVVMPLQLPEGSIQLASIHKHTIRDEIIAGENLSIALTRHGVSKDEFAALIRDLGTSFDVRSLRVGVKYTLEDTRTEQEVITAQKKSPSDTNVSSIQTLHAFEIQMNVAGIPTKVRATRNTNRGSPLAFSVEIQKTPVETKQVALQGEISSSLYAAMLAKGEGAMLVNRFADFFSSDVDFYSQTQKGDKFKLIVEKNYANGKFLGYGRLLAGEYQNGGKTLRGFFFKSKDGKVEGQFDDKGGSIQKSFIRNPLEIIRITSRYGQRFHPVLHRSQAHNGVDYGAPAGTPYWAVADGVVTAAHYNSGAGNMIVIKHTGGYETEYFHSLRFAPGIRPGVRVKQHQVIGYVGSTGRSTGPHLHLGMRKNDRYINPAQQIFPPAEPLSASYRSEFEAYVEPLIASLNAIEST